MLNEIFFGKCPVCGGATAISDALCTNCFNDLKEYSHFCGKCGFPITKPGASCYRCRGKISKRITNIYALYHYNKTMRQILLQMKFYYNIRLAFLLKNIINLPNFQTEYDGIITVPSHLIHKAFRFFHPADVLAKYTAYKLNIPVLHNLKRVKNTAFQSHISKKQRKENVMNAFKCSNFKNNERNILLVDDIFTTGATINECVKVLYNKGIKRIDVLVLAK